MNKYSLSILLLSQAESFTVAPSRSSIAYPISSSTQTVIHNRSPISPLFSTPEGDEDAEVQKLVENSKLSEEEVEQVGNLVADDEWMGLSMELSELVRVAVIEEVKKNTADFIGKDDYKVGDITKEIDSRVKNEVAAMVSSTKFFFFFF